jgi:hypothetical protein
MACREWKDEWIAKLYDELDPVEAAAASAHLARCADCRSTLDELGSVRATLRASAASDSAPPPPARVLVLRPRRMHPALGFGAGLAASLLVFASGLYVGGRSSAGDDRPILPVKALVTRDDLSSLESRLQSLEHHAQTSDALAREPQSLAHNAVTDLELKAEMERLDRRMRGERARDMEFLLNELSATEWRTGKWIDETREAVRYVALRDDGRVSER